MLLTKKRKKRCIVEAIKHLELNIIERKKPEIQFREVNDILEVKQGNELLVEYEKFFYKGDVNHLSIPLKKIEFKDESTLVNYFYNAIYFAIYKKIEKNSKVNIYYEYYDSVDKKNHYSFFFLVVINDREPLLLKDESNSYYELGEF